MRSCSAEPFEDARNDSGPALAIVASNVVSPSSELSRQHTLELRKALATIDSVPSVNYIKRVEVAVSIHHLFARLACSCLVIEGVESADGEMVQRESREVDRSG